MIIVGAVPKVTSPEPEAFYNTYCVPQKPVIIASAAEHWAARKRWTREYLVSTIGQKIVTVKEANSNIHPEVSLGSKVRRSKVDFGEYVDLVWSNNPDKNKKYLSGDEQKLISNYTESDPTFRPLLNDIEVPVYCKNVHTVGFWLSASNVVASLHYDSDGSHNINVQIKGQKRILLFAPSQNVYPFSALSGHPYNFSQVDITNPDYTRFPGFKVAKCVEAIISEGEMLFIPSYWHHAVFHQGDVNINVNFWWRPDNFLLSKASFHSTFSQMVLRASSPVTGDGPAKRGLPADTTQFIQTLNDLICTQYKI